MIDLVEGNLNDPFTNFFTNDNAKLAYRLSYNLTSVESTIRWFKASIPPSGYSTSDRNLLEKELTAYIDTSEVIIWDVQEFYPHIMGTIQHHVTDNNWMIARFDDVRTSIGITGKMAHFTAFLESYHLVYLIEGVQPFQRGRLQETMIKALNVLQGQNECISARLEQDVRNTADLQKLFRQLKNTSDTILYLSNHTKATEVDSHQSHWGQLVTKLLGNTFKNKDLERRRQSLELMRPIFDNSLSLLEDTAIELGAANRYCLGLKEQLARYRQAVDSGWDVSEWVFKVEEEMVKGFDELKLALRDFEDESRRLGRQGFDH